MNRMTVFAIFRRLLVKSKSPRAWFGREWNKMFTYARLGCLLLVFLGFTALVLAQGSAAPSQPGPAQIYLDVSVTPKSGPPIADLQQQDFTVLDNKVPQTITSFHSVTGRDAHVEIVLVIDAVNDTVVNVGYERLQIDKFLRAEEGRLAYPMAIAIFTDKGIEGVTSFSSDGNALSDALQKNDTGLRDIGRSAAFWGAAERFQLSVTPSLNLSQWRYRVLAAK